MRIRPTWLKLASLAVCLALVAAGSAVGAAGPEAPRDEALGRRIDAVVERVRARELRSDRDTPWVVMHALIAFGSEARVTDVAAEGEQVGAAEFLLTRATWEGRPIFRGVDGVPTLPTRGITPGVRESFQVQDHVDQFLFAFAGAGVPLDAAIRAEGGERFRVADLLAAAKRGFVPTQELGWTLGALAHYEPVDVAWVAADGRSWTLAKLVEIAVGRDLTRETEGGPHHLYGLATALEARYEAQPGEPLRGAWRAAFDALQRNVELTRRYQRPDGELSAAMQAGSAPSRSSARLVHATGHTLEWMTVALSGEALRADWVVRAVERLVAELERAAPEEITPGSRYHAAHALRRYRARTGAAQATRVEPRSEARELEAEPGADALEPREQVR